MLIAAFKTLPSKLHIQLPHSVDDTSAVSALESLPCCLPSASTCALVGLWMPRPWSTAALPLNTQVRASVCGLSELGQGELSDAPWECVEVGVVCV